MFGKVRAYGCISSSRRLDDYSETKVYKSLEEKILEVQEKLQSFFIHEDDIRIDVLTSARPKRVELEKIIDELGISDTIVIDSLYALGSSPQAVIKIYKRIYEKGIGLLIPDYSVETGLSKYSTTDYSMEEIKVPPDRFDELCEDVLSEKIIKNQGRKKIEVDDDFEKIYWLYENYFIDEKTAVNNNIKKLSRAGFYRLCDDYENMKKYAVRYNEKQRVQDSEHSIGKKPKRYGTPPPSQFFDRYEELLDDNTREEALKIACEEFKLPAMTLIDLKRYKLKLDQGKSSVYKAFAQYRDDALIKEMTENP